MIGVLEITVHAAPGAQGSKVIVQPKNRPKPVMLEQNRVKVKSWRGAVVECAEAAMDEILGHDEQRPMFEGPVLLEAVFSFTRPASHFGTGRNAGVLKGTSPCFPTGKNVGDLSKLIRSTEDALTSAGAWKDDSLVAGVKAIKVYCNEQHPRAQPVPGAWLRITAMGDLQ
jgi:crossover junction endodeoxyribonuclease RusA